MAETAVSFSLVSALKFKLSNHASNGGLSASCTLRVDTISVTRYCYAA